MAGGGVSLMRSRYHAWNHYTGWRILEGINPKDVLTVDTSFNRMVREYV